MGNNMGHAALAPASARISRTSTSRACTSIWRVPSTGKHAVSAVAAFLLLGCAASLPQGARPDLTVTASSFRNTDASQNTGQNPSTAFDALWWQSFADPGMAELVTRALESNHDVQITAQRVTQARGQHGRGLQTPAHLGHYHFGFGPAHYLGRRVQARPTRYTCLPGRTCAGLGNRCVGWCACQCQRSCTRCLGR